MRKSKTEMIDLSLIDPNASNPNEMSPEMFNNLVTEVKQGFLQPILVRPMGKRYEIVDGEHRFKATKQAGFKVIQAVIAEMTDDEARIKTATMNDLKGTKNIVKYAELVDDLLERYDVKELSLKLYEPEEELMSLKLIIDSPDATLEQRSKGGLVKELICPECKCRIDTSKAEVVRRPIDSPPSKKKADPLKKAKERMR